MAAVLGCSAASWHAALPFVAPSDAVDALVVVAALAVVPAFAAASSASVPLEDSASTAQAAHQLARRAGFAVAVPATGLAVVGSSACRVASCRWPAPVAPSSVVAGASGGAAWPIEDLNYLALCAQKSQPLLSNTSTSPEELLTLRSHCLLCHQLLLRC